MKIQPNQISDLSLHDGERGFEAQLLYIKDHTMILRCDHWQGAKQNIQFKSPFFYGEGTVTDIIAQNNEIQVHLHIESIHFRRGLVVDEVL